MGSGSLEKYTVDLIRSHNSSEFITQVLIRNSGFQFADDRRMATGPICICNIGAEKQ